MNELIEKTKQWFHQKEIIRQSNPLKQLEKTQEELTETRDAVIRLHEARLIMTIERCDTEMHQNAHMFDIKDGIGDIVVTLIGVCEMLNISLEECLQGAYDVISERTGKMVDGKFVKNLIKDNEQKEISES
jgi:NTP pyrophosphatase (non-canonical NTP hydrolase)